MYKFDYKILKKGNKITRISRTVKNLVSYLQKGSISVVTKVS